MQSYDLFEGPAEYAIYGGPKGAIPKRVTGVETLSDAETFIFNHRKGYPSWEYSVWKANGWKEVKID